MYPAVGGPALAVWSEGAWRYAQVRARQDWPPSETWPNGRVIYQVTVDLLGDTTVRWMSYEWPQPGLRVAQRGRQGGSG